MTLEECRLNTGRTVIYSDGYGTEDTGTITRTGRLWTFVRFGTGDTPSAVDPARLSLAAERAAP